MKHGSLFSGIGGFDLAAEWMGWENIFHCEWNEFGKKVLNYYWPQSISYHDITKTDFTIHRGNIDILTGGFPCQPYSMAGKRLGKEDERHLWPSMLRAIKEIQPRWVVGENVYGLVNWSGGLVFHEVQTDLEAAGYEVFPYVLPACSVNAPHRRDRVWFVAYAKDTGSPISKLGKKKSSKQIQAGSYVDRFESLGNAPHPNGNGFNQCDCQHEINTSEGGQYAQRNIKPMGKYNAADTNSTRWKQSNKEMARRLSEQFNGTRIQQDDADTCNEGLQRKQNKGEDRRTESDGIDNRRGNTSGVFRSNWQEFPTQSPICTGDDGLSSRLDGITFSKWRNESIKAAGNAIVPQVVYQIFKAIQEYEATQTPTV